MSRKDRCLNSFLVDTKLSLLRRKMGYLGVTFHENLNWQPHMSNLRSLRKSL